MAFQESQTNALNGQAAESQARAQKIAAETKAIPVELENDRIKAVSTNLRVGTQDDKEFERRLKATDRMLAERKLNLETAKALK
jgi:aconitase B